MALIKCPECGKEVSDMAVSCPGCGYPIEKYVQASKTETARTDSENQKKKKVLVHKTYIDKDGALIDVEQEEDAPPVWAGAPGKNDKPDAGNTSVLSNAKAASAPQEGTEKTGHGRFMVFYFAFAILISALAIGIIAGVTQKPSGKTSGFTTGGNSSAGSYSDSKSGSYTLNMDGSTAITLGYTEDAFQDFLDCCAKSDMEGANSLLWNGKTFRVDSGTSCTIEDWGFAISKVKITSGTYKGEVGYTSSDALKK